MNTLSTVVSRHRPSTEGEFSDLQNTLAPPIFYRDARLEVHGQVVPKDDVGGDLVDLVATDRDLTAYVADVSGHGLRPALLMGMLKTAVRYGLLLNHPLTRLLAQVNSVLPGVKEPNMYATFAALRFDQSNEVDYISAGHVPLLHFRLKQKDVLRYSMDQFPLGLFERVSYASRRLQYEAGDIFALVTDGVVEAGSDSDAEFGLQRVANILHDLARCSLSGIYKVVQDAIPAYGTQEDDQTVLLVRALA